jgi:hypothetical protein
MLLGALFSEISPILNFRHKHDLMKEFGQWVKANTEPNAIIFDQDERHIIEHFSGRATKNPPFPEFASDTYSPDANRILAETKAFLEQKLREGIPIYTTSIGINSYDPEFRFKNLLEKFFRLKHVSQTTKEEWHQGSTNLILYRELLYKIERK